MPPTGLSSDCTLFVGSIPQEITLRKLREHFDRFGEVEDVMLKKGFAFVTYSSSRDANNALAESTGTELDGRKLVIELAKPENRRKVCSICGAIGHLASVCYFGDGDSHRRSSERPHQQWKSSRRRSSSQPRRSENERHDRDRVTIRSRSPKYRHDGERSTARRSRSGELVTRRLRSRSITSTAISRRSSPNRRYRSASSDRLSKSSAFRHDNNRNRVNERSDSRERKRKDKAQDDRMIRDRKNSRSVSDDEAHPYNNARKRSSPSLQRRRINSSDMCRKKSRS